MDFFVKAKIINRTPLMRRIIQSIIDSERIWSGEITADVPRIKRILNIFEPIAFPRASALSPFRVATMEVTSSGSDVPIATIVRPIKFWLTPKDTEFGLHYLLPDYLPE